MNGGVSHMESFDPKPMLTQIRGQDDCRNSLRRHARSARNWRSSGWWCPMPTAISGILLYPLQVGFQKHGQSGIEVSDWFPHMAQASRQAGHRALDVDHRQQPRRPDAIPLGTAQERRRVPDAGGLGPLWARHRSTTICRSSSRSGNREYWNERDGHYLGPAHDAVPLRIDPGQSTRLLASRSGLLRAKRRRSASI